MFTRDYCVKVANGKGAEFADFVHDVSAKLMQARVDAGEATWGAVARVVTPAGTTARCDYHVVYGYTGKLPEPVSAATTEASLKRAGINMSAKDMGAKRDSLSRLVSLEVARAVDAVPMANMSKGMYVRLNHYKIRSGQSTNSWVNIERSTWKPLVEADNKDGHPSGWTAYLITAPSGESVYSNALTVDTFPNWEALTRGIPSTALWPKVHPTRSRAEWGDRLATIAERQLVEIVTVVEFAAPKKGMSAGGVN